MKPEPPATANWWDEEGEWTWTCACGEEGSSSDTNKDICSTLFWGVTCKKCGRKWSASIVELKENVG